MKCSLIIPAYNAEATIADCIESALRQSMEKREYEIIVVDDGSTDGTQLIVDKYPVRYIRQSNQGPAVARNSGVELSKSNIVVFTDSDCELDTKFLVNIITPIVKNNEIVAVQGSYKTKQVEFIPRFCQAEIETRYSKMLKNDNIDFIGSYAAAYRKDIFINNGGFDSRFRIASGEDAELSFKLSKSGYKMIFVPCAFVYHKHPSKFNNYLKVKYNRGYWRVKLYRMHPGKILRDSYTLQTVKYQVVGTPIILICIPLVSISKVWAIPIVAILATYAYETMKFTSIYKKHKYSNKLLITPMLVLRSSAIFLGLVFGTISEVINSFEI